MATSRDHVKGPRDPVHSPTLSTLSSLASDDLEAYSDYVENLVKSTFRPANILMTNVQICLMFWIFGRSLTLVFLVSVSTFDVSAMCASR